MSYLYDYGEALICFVPIFLLIVAIGLSLLWNNLPDMTVKKSKKDDA